MKFKVTMKDPDVLYMALDESIKKDLNKLNLPTNEMEAIFDALMENMERVSYPRFKLVIDLCKNAKGK